MLYGDNNGDIGVFGYMSNRPPKKKQPNPMPQPVVDNDPLPMRPKPAPFPTMEGAGEQFVPGPMGKGSSLPTPSSPVEPISNAVMKPRVTNSADLALNNVSRNARDLSDTLGQAAGFTPDSRSYLEAMQGAQRAASLNAAPKPPEMTAEERLSHPMGMEVSSTPPANLDPITKAKLEVGYAPQKRGILGVLRDVGLGFAGGGIGGALIGGINGAKMRYENQLNNAIGRNTDQANFERQQMLDKENSAKKDTYVQNILADNERAKAALEEQKRFHDEQATNWRALMQARDADRQSRENIAEQNNQARTDTTAASNQNRLDVADKNIQARKELNRQPRISETELQRQAENNVMIKMGKNAPNGKVENPEWRRQADILRQNPERKDLSDDQLEGSITRRTKGKVPRYINIKDSGQYKQAVAEEVARLRGGNTSNNVQSQGQPQAAGQGNQAEARNKFQQGLDKLNAKYGSDPVTLTQKIAQLSALIKQQYGINLE